LNPVKANLVNRAEDWGFSSFNVFTGKDTYHFIKHNIITDQVKDYADYVNNYKEDEYYFLKDLLVD
jgi:hypothetical protein